MQPGETITPGSPPPQTPPSPPSPQAAAPWQYNTEQVPAAQPAGGNLSGPISWTASEYIAQHKTTGWYVLLALAGMAGGVLVYLLTKDKISVAVIMIVAVLFGVYAARKPRVLSYQIDNYAIYIGGRPHPYHDFKSFNVVDEAAFRSITLLPLKRFMPPISMYYDPKDENAILDTLSQFLPFEERSHDMVDSFMRKIRL